MAEDDYVARWKDKRMENRILIHRYLYYVVADPRLTDGEYDVMEREAMAKLPPTSPVHLVGSSNRESYSPEIIELAESLRTTTPESIARFKATHQTLLKEHKNEYK